MAKILVAGGGSGGHVTPVSAVVTEIKKQSPSSDIRFWTDFSFFNSAKTIMHTNNPDVKTSRVLSGKFRRYTHFGVKDYLKHPSIMLMNLRDLFLVVFGTIQCFFKLIFWRPKVAFLKGGFVCLPIGFAARILRIPIIIHDSDASAGLANRILSKYAAKIATGMPTKYYSYPKEKTVHVGIPVSSDLSSSSHESKTELKRRFGFDENLPLTVIIGGGLGAKNINDAVASTLPKLTKVTSVILVSGKAQYEELKNDIGHKKNFKLFDFIASGYEDIIRASDVVVSRAGATSIAEISTVKKPLILVPNEKLPGKHQLKNAQVLLDENAAIVICDDELASKSEILTKSISDLLADSPKMCELSKNIAKLSKPDASSEMAKIILNLAKK